ncbi:MAG: hypothetical protein M3Y48_23570 [Actinomycetota bacterium]|nr:hypothetical protein [Actinomycetota bacterium]
MVNRVDQLMLLLNLLLGFVSFVPLPTRLVAEHTVGADARTASLLYGATLTGTAVAFNLIWRHLVRAELLVAGLAPEFVRDVTIRYLLGLAGYVAATLLALAGPLLTVLASALLALMFALGPSGRPAFAPADTAGEHG